MGFCMPALDVSNHTRRVAKMRDRVVVFSFLFVLGTNGRMPSVVIAPKNLSTEHYGLNKRKENDIAEENTRAKQEKDPGQTTI